MPTGISDVKYKEGAFEDIKNNFGNSHQQRIKKKFKDIKTNCKLGSRDPRLSSEYKKVDEVKGYTIYRKWVGKSLARLFFAVKGNEMILVSVLPKDDNTYKFTNYHNRL